jgi:hypothetical protein
MSDGTMAPVPANHPLMIAWTEYEASPDYARSYGWAKKGAEYVEGSLWAAFVEGFKAATERAASLHEQINPASDMERHHGDPGAGGMGAVIEYRDTIRAMGRL